MAIRQYIGARYVPKFFENSATGDSTWAGNTSYEPLTMVTWNSNTYTSKKPVPANVGNPAENPSYWVVTSRSSEAIEILEGQVADLDERVDDVEEAQGDMSDDIDTIKDRFVSGVLGIPAGGTGADTLHGARNSLHYAYGVALNNGQVLPAWSSGNTYTMTFNTTVGFFGILMTSDSTGAKEGMYLIRSTSSTAYAKTIVESSSLEVRASGTKLILKESTATSSAFLITIYDYNTLMTEAIEPTSNFPNITANASPINTGSISEIQPFNPELEVAETDERESE